MIVVRGLELRVRGKGIEEMIEAFFHDHDLHR